ncbi:BON domain-containing protein [Paraburkholderia azotifigens]|uniref:BON domain-containing protein n=1 Tax=Paraburkholderia azotifigens TaxID=2057004 RepID=A0A5C6VHR6_9BURK|nr:BON domain-containing protein [Paraburkholderia azotifigens]TXC84470.1 BON domain-containing protein [Paraburkholderia azotifigens]
MTRDQILKHAVEKLLGDSAPVDSRDITVQAAHGIVTLSGTVPNAFQKHLTEEIMRRVEGCRGFVMDLGFAATPDHRQADETLASRVVAVLAGIEGLSPDRVRVAVEHGCVTLTGQVDHEPQRDAIELVVGSIDGIVELSNLIALPARRHSAA